ncbi:MAG: sigma-70 family RNA polymerase sigma factor [bacterium]|nr:sigma-70 family RNA polymerase sigma factor [bacterium]
MAHAEKDSVLEYYLKELSGSHPLTGEQECRLTVLMKEGDLSARDQLIEANLRFVVSIAIKYKNRGVPLSDLISAGNVGLITATERFDETRGYKFISYAVWWIRQAILQTLAEHGRLVRLPINRSDLLRRIGNFNSDFQRQNSRLPTEEELAKEFELTEEQIIDALAHSPVIMSLDSPVRNEKTTLLDIMPDTTQDSPETAAMNNALKHEIKDLLDTLTDRESDVIRLYFGLDGQEWTLESIAQKYKLTRERVRQIKEVALRKLRHPIRGRKLMSYAEAV